MPPYTSVNEHDYDHCVQHYDWLIIVAILLLLLLF